MANVYRKRRSRRGSLTAEYITTMWVIFLVVFFPFLNLTTICLRSFFLWFAANQAAVIGSQAKTWQNSVTVSGVTYQPALTLAANYANQIHNAFLGWDYYPNQAGGLVIQIVLAPIGAATPVTPQSTPLSAPPDVTSYVPHIRVAITAQVYPLVPVNFSVPGVSTAIPGITAPYILRVRSEAIFENPNGLTI